MYYDLLIKQYLSATGITSFNNSKEEIGELIEWIKQQKKIKGIYQNYLLSSVLYFDDKNSAEIGKGNHDTITSEFGHSVLVTSLASSFKNNKFSERIIPGTLYIGSEVPCALIEDKQKGIRRHSFLSDIDLFYTQNIYSLNELNPLIKVHNKGKSIAVGAYGKMYDKDRISKIEQLRNIKSQLIDQKYKEVYIYSNDNYIYFIHTDFDRYKTKHRKAGEYTLIKER